MSARPPWALRACAVLAVAGYGALALGSGLDRMSTDRPELAGRVPALFASEAYSVLGPRAIAAGDTAKALAVGKVAVLAAPIEPNNTALLGSALKAAKQADAAERTFRVAGKLGWRVPSTQAYWQMRALVVSDFATAALRTDALLRQQPSLLAERSLLDPLERNTNGREALVARMQLRPDWLTDYARNVADIPEDSLLQRAVTLDLAAQRGVKVGCDNIGPVVTRLVGMNIVGIAEQLWRGHCALPRSGVLFDGALSTLQLDQPPSPFAWSLVGYSDVSVGLASASDGNGQQVQFESTASFPRRVLTQLVVVPAGHYRLSWAAGRSDGQPASGLRISVTCHIDINSWASGTYDAQRKRWFADLQIPDDCPGHWVNFGLVRGAGNVWLEHTMLEAVAAPQAK